ncbi:methyltransferase-like protein 23 isoform X1 [Eucalyptus grandis]|uniref:methyltransferase-like protein 23 isoform X1 n=1 Tax=Eucalyptus grandis TaxID=71139 RepID=UPI00192E96A4|nr:methyltransferase-like protein 23 isoform X1 [Eucalyptus grandis]
MADGDGDGELVGRTASMTTVSRHFFGDGPDGPAFSISIIENMKEEYGLFVWPCSVVLAEYVWQQKSRFAGANVVELGAGTSLPGLVAARLGCDVTLTDDAGRLEVLDNMKQVSQLNNLSCKVVGLSWGVWDESIFSLFPQFILGADVLYETSAFDDLFATVSFLLQNSPGSVFITTYHNRREPPLTSDAAESAGMNFNIAGIPGHHLVLMTSQVTINRLCEAPIDQKPSQVASSA